MGQAHSASRLPHWSAAIFRKQERLHRALEERRARGDDTGDALEAAIRDEGLIDLPGEPSLSDAAREMLEAGEDEEDESWRESLADANCAPEEDEPDDWLGDRERHPLLERVMDLNKRLYDWATAADQRQNENVRRLLGATGEMLGGLAQALGSPDFEPPSGLSLVQLKRALRGVRARHALHASPRQRPGLGCRNGGRRSAVRGSQHTRKRV
jgi:hypothetical protein